MKDQQTAPIKADNIWICEECIRQRCYQLPTVRSARTKICRCDMCGLFGPMWCLDDLIPGWLDDKAPT